jgi:hypothetical protein
MTRGKFLLVLLLIIGCSTNAQSTEDSVKQTVNKLFTGMKSSNGTMISEAFADSAVLQTISRDKVSGKIFVRNESVKDFAKSISTLAFNSADERITFSAIKIDADLASVWTPYQFYLNGKFSHCGVNSFQLVRINDEWKIQYLIDTRRKEHCED